MSTVGQGQARLSGPTTSCCHDNMGTHSPARGNCLTWTDPSVRTGLPTHEGLAHRGPLLASSGPIILLPPREKEGCRWDT